MDNIKEKAEKFAETSGLSHDVLRRAIEAWRRLQSASSDKKAPGYSQED